MIGGKLLEKDRLNIINKDDPLDTNSRQSWTIIASKLYVQEANRGRNEITAGGAGAREFRTWFTEAGGSSGLFSFSSEENGSVKSIKDGSYFEPVQIYAGRIGVETYKVITRDKLFLISAPDPALKITTTGVAPNLSLTNKISEFQKNMVILLTFLRVQFLLLLK